MRKLLTIFVVSLMLAACTPPKVTQALVSVMLTADGSSFRIELPAGSTAQQAFDKAGITLSTLDRSDPPVYTVLSDGAAVRLIRVREEFEVEKVVIPFERKVIQNETLPVGESRLSQPGKNGTKEITYRRLFEDGVETSRTEVKSVVLEEAVPEILMIGSQTPFTSLPIPGRLAYLSAGNAWIMEKSTGERKAMVTTGDLDGRIFSLSPDGRWLLFTRKVDRTGAINSLWAVRVDEEKTVLVDLKVGNVIHTAQWSPDSSSIAFSTVEPRDAAPGWQANNDLQLVKLSASGFVSPAETLIETNSGGVYGWWGTEFAWSPEGDRLVYARPDGIGFYNLEDKSQEPLRPILPLQTGGDWAWVTGVNWGPDGQVLYEVDHVAPPGSSAAEQSPLFDLIAVLVRGPAISLVSRVGMFAYPTPSPLQIDPQGEQGYQVAFLQALNPDQSDSSRYRLVVMDRDGSNRMILFPEEGAPGLDPQRVVWSPAALEEEGFVVAVIYQNNIWLVSVGDGKAQQITGDGLTVRIDWR